MYCNHEIITTDGGQAYLLSYTFVCHIQMQNLDYLNQINLIKTTL